MPDQCKNQHVVGCYQWNESHIHVRSGFDKSATNAIIYHELAHYCGYRKEADADAWAYMYMSGRQVPRSMEFLKKTIECEKGIRTIIK